MSAPQHTAHLLALIPSSAVLGVVTARTLRRRLQPPHRCGPDPTARGTGETVTSSLPS